MNEDYDGFDPVQERTDESISHQGSKSALKDNCKSKIKIKISRS